MMYRYLSDVLSVNGVSLLSIGIQYPLFILVYVYIVIRVCILHGFGGIWPMWLMLGIALVAWILTQFGCSKVSWFFIGHVIWHVCIAYVAVYLMVLGLLNDDGEYGFQRVESSDSGVWWILVESKQKKKKEIVSNEAEEEENCDRKNNKKKGEESTGKLGSMFSKLLKKQKRLSLISESF